MRASATLSSRAPDFLAEKCSRLMANGSPEEETPRYTAPKPPGGPRGSSGSYCHVPLLRTMGCMLVLPFFGGVNLVRPNGPEMSRLVGEGRAAWAETKLPRLRSVGPGPSFMERIRSQAGLLPHGSRRGGPMWNRTGCGMYSPFRTSEAYRGEKPVALIIFAIGGFARSGTTSRANHSFHSLLSPCAAFHSALAAAPPRSTQSHPQELSFAR